MLRDVPRRSIVGRRRGYVRGRLLSHRTDRCGGKDACRSEQAPSSNCIRRHGGDPCQKQDTEASLRRNGIDLGQSCGGGRARPRPALQSHCHGARSATVLRLPNQVSRAVPCRLHDRDGADRASARQILDSRFRPRRIFEPRRRPRTSNLDNADRGLAPPADCFRPKAGPGSGIGDGLGLADRGMAPWGRSTRRSGHVVSVQDMSRQGLELVLALSHLDEIDPNETGSVSHVRVSSRYTSAIVSRWAVRG